MTLAFVTACGADRETWERRWRKVAAHLTGASDERDDRTPAVVAADPDQPWPYPRGGAASARPAQLPMGSAVFVGRGQALTCASHLIGRSVPVRIPLLIGGPIGVGKTAFALRLADNLCADFPDGQLYADLDASEPDQSCDDVICGFLRALEVPAALMPDDPAQRAGLYRSLLAQQRLLVLLENARDESQVRPLLGRAAHSQIMVTSRARLLGLDGAHRIELDTFTRQESITLISRIVGAERVQAEYEAVDEIAELCGDLPLAVSIAARRIAARPEWTIAYTAGQLADRDRLMESLSVGDVNVADRLAAAYQGLPPSCREALHQLAAGGAGWTTAIGLAAALGIAVHAADALLESLVDSGLLTRAGVAGRYCVSALVTVFATDVRRDASRRSVPLVARHGRSAQGAPRQPAGLAAPGS